MSSTTLNAFRTRLFSHSYDDRQLEDIVRTLKANGKEIDKVKLKMIMEYKETMTNIKTTSDTIQLDINKYDLPEIVPNDTSDFAVACKYIQVSKSASSRGIEFNLTLNDVKMIMKKKKCYYTGIMFDYSNPEKSLTFDRLDSKKGYVKGNVVACRKDVNELKNILIEHKASVFKDNAKLLKKVVDKFV
jgi:hypothetical protein